MSQKTMIAIAASMTAFVLVLVGGVFGRVSTAQAAVAQAPVATLDPSAAAVWNQREAAYRSLIDEANQRLLAASQPTSSSMTGDASGVASRFAANVTPEQAAVLAVLASRGAAITKLPELVDYQGTVAYEVQTTMGLIYIDATSGSVLYNGAVRQMLMAAETEHESGDD